MSILEDEIVGRGLNIPGDNPPDNAAAQQRNPPPVLPPPVIPSNTTPPPIVPAPVPAPTTGGGFVPTGGGGFVPTSGSTQGQPQQGLFVAGNPNGVAQGTVLGPGQTHPLFGRGGQGGGGIDPAQAQEMFSQLPEGVQGALTQMFDRFGGGLGGGEGQLFKNLQLPGRGIPHPDDVTGQRANAAQFTNPRDQRQANRKRRRSERRRRLGGRAGAASGQAATATSPSTGTTTTTSSGGGSFGGGGFNSFWSRFFGGGF